MLTGSPTASRRPRGDKEISVFIPTTFLPSPHDPWQPPDRRRRRCDYLLQHGRRPDPAGDDPDTWAAWRYLCGLSRRRDAAGRGRLARRFPAVAEAHNFYTSAEPLARAELEARLLAHEGDEAIAARLGLSPAGVAAYHALYFAVRPRLHAGGHVWGAVLGGKAHQGLAPDDHESLLRVYGYALGSRGVDALLDYLRDPPAVPASLDGLDPAGLRQLRDRLRVKLHVLSLTAPANAASPATWAWLRERVAAARHEFRGSGDGADGEGAIRPALDLVAGLLQRQRGETEPPGAAEVVVVPPWAGRRRQGEAGGVSHSLVAVSA
jgi:hypothetical protein